MILLRAPYDTPTKSIGLISPSFSDVVSRKRTVNLKRSMSGLLKTTIKDAGLKELTYSFDEVESGKLEELKTFFSFAQGKSISLLDHNNDVWEVKLNTFILDSNCSTRGRGNTQSTTNILTYPNSFSNAIWTKSNSIAAFDNGYLDPYWSQNAWLLKNTISNSTHYVEQGFSATSGLQYVFSVRVKPNELGYVALEFNGGAFSTNYVFFNVSAGTVGTVNGSVSYGIDPVENGYYRIWIKATASSTSTNSVRIYVSPSDNVLSYVGAVESVYFCGAQVEQSSSVTEFCLSTRPTTRFENNNFTLKFVGTLVTSLIETPTLWGTALWGDYWGHS